MNVKKIIDERIRRRIEGVDVEADVHAVVAANVGEGGQVTSVSSTSSATADSRSSKEQDPPSE